MTLTGDGLHWSVLVPKQELLAGSHLLTGEGKIHFSKSGMVATNHQVLKDFGTV
jgi:hypothetical protein